MTKRKLGKLFISVASVSLAFACSSRFWGHSSQDGGDDLPQSDRPLALTASLERYEDCAELKADLIAVAAEQFEISRRMQVYWHANSRYAKGSRDFDESQAEMSTASPSMPGGINTAVSDSSSSPSANGTAPGADGASGVDAVEIGTNVQEQKVDEADQIKMGARHLFVVDNQHATQIRIAVTQRSPLKYLGDLSLDDMQSASLYVTAERLVVAGAGLRERDGGTIESGFWVRVYDASKASLPSLIGESFFRGQYDNSRFIDGRLILVVRDLLAPAWDPSAEQAASKEEFATFLEQAELLDLTAESAADVPCTHFTKGSIATTNTPFIRVVAFDVEAGTIASEVAVPAASNAQLYMNEDQIVLAGQPLSRPVWIHPDDKDGNAAYQDFLRDLQQHLQLVSITYDGNTGTLTPEALGVVDGTLKPFASQWSLKAMAKEGRRFLAVFTTSGSVRAEDGLGEAVNHLYVLEPKDSQLEIVGSIASFAPNEDIRAVRFDGDYAYVVTFKRTDPLFAINLTDPTNPKIDGELKIPGFSMYMHPAGNGQLIGVGYDSEEKDDGGDGAYFQGLQLSLFYASDAANLRRLDNVVIGKRGSFSEVTQDHHAFYFDPSSLTIGLPLVSFNDDGDAETTTLNQSRIHSQREFSGAIFYRIADNALAEVGRVTHFDLLPPICQSNFQPLFWTNTLQPQADVRRIFRSGDIIYTVSNYAVRVIDATSLAPKREVRFDFQDCPTQGFQGGFE